MPYQELQLPHGTPEDVRQLVRNRVDPLLADVHTMFRLPLDGEQQPGFEAGCNLSAVLTLLSVVAGVSAELYENPGLDKKDDSGERFKSVLEKHFPWSEEPDDVNTIKGRHAAEILYDAFRNPLAHSLGMYEGPYLGHIKVAKGPLFDKEIVNIECSESRLSSWTGPTLKTDSREKKGRTKTVLTVKCLYWGIRRMIYNVISERISLNQGQIVSPIPTSGVLQTPIAVTANSKTTITRVESSSTEPDDS